MATSTIKHFRGDTWLRSWVIKDASGAPVDLTGASARLHVRPQEGTDNADELILAATVGLSGLSPVAQRSVRTQTMLSAKARTADFSRKL